MLVLIRLSQGTGRSVISGPSPSLTDVNGMIAFTATNLVSGNCEFAATNPSPTLVLSPTEATEVSQGQVQPVVAKLLNVDDPEGLPVFFSVAGANPRLKLVRADADGQAQMDLLGVFTGDDSIRASAEVDEVDLLSNTTRIRWMAGQRVTEVNLNFSPTTATLDEPLTLSATLTDVSSEPPAPVAGETIELDLDGETCDDTTDAEGLATCSLTPRFEGFATLSAWFAGTAELTPSESSIGINVMQPSASENIINGTPQRDTLVGTDGNDVITGFGDRDNITTGGGSDRIIYTSTVDFGDRITDFAVGSDVIDLTGLGISSGDPIAEGLLLFRERRGNTTILFDADGPGRGRPRAMVTLTGVSAADAAQLSSFVGFGP